MRLWVSYILILLVNLDIECLVTFGKAATIRLRTFSRLIGQIVILSRQFAAYQLLFIDFGITRILHHFWCLHRIRLIDMRLGRLNVLVRRNRMLIIDQEILCCLVGHSNWRIELPRNLTVRFHIDSVGKVWVHLFIIGCFYSDVVMNLFICNFPLLDDIWLH